MDCVVQRFLFIDLILVLLEFFQLEDIFFAEDLSLNLLPLLLSFIIEGVLLEHVEPVFAIYGFIQIELMGVLVLEIHQIKLWDDSRMILEACLPNCKQVLNTVLHSGLNLAFMQQILEHLKD